MKMTLTFCQTSDEQHTYRCAMSENKRNRKSNQNKEPRRPIILAKKSDRDDKSMPDKPRILHRKTAQEQNKPPTQISIASRPVEPNARNADATKSNRSQPTTSTASTSKETPAQTTSIENTANDSKLPIMKKPFPIISDHYQIQSHAQDFLIETNTDFICVGVIGTKGAGKSFILNMLVDDKLDLDDKHQVNEVFKERGGGGVFPLQNQLKEPLSNVPATEGIQMYITKNRTILLDCSPILCNPYKKDAILNELDDLKMLIFLLSVCNTLIVVEDCGFNMNLVRLLTLAETIKVDVYENELNEYQYSPNILIFKNKCQNRDFHVEAKQRTSNLYRTFFKCSGLQLMHSAQNSDKKASTIVNEEKQLDIFYFPWLSGSNDNQYQAHADVDVLLAEFRQRIFMSPRAPFPMPNQQTTAFTEKNWYSLAYAVWESHKSNYFLRKFESLKEKEWALRV